mmetsp:Transcript_52031/g.71020  ORF Transcript_52031/g.71020 Transcript_52031/m.71020 type:complete len:81 (+) Transcript_52031:1419-1661(+)
MICVSSFCISPFLRFLRRWVGLALHALHRYDEALPSLGKALELEKKTNKASIRQINEAIKFAEVKFGKLMQARRAGEKGR